MRISSGGDSTATTPSYTWIREPMRRLCHCLIALTIAGRGQSPEKVTTLDLFLLRSMDEGPVLNVPHFLAHYLHRIAPGRHGRSQMTGGISFLVWLDILECWVMMILLISRWMWLGYH